MVAFRAAALALLAFGLTPLTAPAGAQALPENLRALDEQLPGDLVNDPSRIDWESYGPEFYAESFQDERIPGGAARRFHINEPTEFIYTAGTNIPLIRTVKRGEQITIGFYARTVESTEEDGRGILRVRFQKDSPPYPGFGEKTLRIGTEWDWYEVTAEVEQTLRGKDGIVAVQFGRTKQVLEIGQAIIVSGARSIVGGVNEAATAPEPKAEAAALPKPLQGLGTLLNDPADREWGFAITEDSGMIDERDDASIWLGKATRLSTTDDDPTGGVDALVKITEAISAGDEITVALAAKSVEVGQDGKGSELKLRVEAPSAGGTLSQSSIVLGGRWQLVRLKTKAKADIAAGAGFVGLRVSGASQGVDIGPVYVFRSGAATE